MGVTNPSQPSIRAVSPGLCADDPGGLSVPVWRPASWVIRLHRGREVGLFKQTVEKRKNSLTLPTSTVDHAMVPLATEKRRLAIESLASMRRLLGTTTDELREPK